MNIKSALLALTAISVLASPASTSPLVERDIKPQYSKYAICIQEAVPTYPFGDVQPTSEKVGECFARITGQGKRSAAAEPDLQTSPVVAVGNVLTIRAPDDDVLNPDASAWCDNDRVNDNFIWVTEIRDNAVNFCTRLVKEVNDRGLSEDGGVGQIVNLFTDGHDKQGHQLKDNMKVLATFVLKVYSPAGMAFETVKEVAKGLQGGCVQGLTLLATKGPGCTDDLKYFRPSKAKGYTGTGAIGGLLHILYKGVVFASVKADFVNK